MPHAGLPSPVALTNPRSPRPDTRVGSSQAASSRHCRGAAPRHSALVTSLPVSTLADGAVDVSVGIERDAAFDDDGLVSATHVGQSGGPSLWVQAEPDDVHEVGALLGDGAVHDLLQLHKTC